MYSASGHRDMAAFFSPPYGLYAILRAVLRPLPRVTVACCSLTMSRKNACRKAKKRAPAQAFFIEAKMIWRGAIRRKRGARVGW